MIFAKLTLLTHLLDHIFDMYVPPNGVLSTSTQRGHFYYAAAVHKSFFESKVFIKKLKFTLKVKKLVEYKQTTFGQTKTDDRKLF